MPDDEPEPFDVYDGYVEDPKIAVDDLTDRINYYIRQGCDRPEAINRAVEDAQAAIEDAEG